MPGSNTMMGRLLYPVVLLGNTALALFLAYLGLSGAVVVAITAVVATLLVLLAERHLPFSRNWQTPAGDTDADTAHLITTLVVAEGIGRGLFFFTSDWLPISTPIWPQDWPLLLQLLLALVLSDAIAYLGHRLLHSVPVLWRFHRIHHAAPRLYWLNAFRNHPADVLVSATATMFPLAMLGVGGTVRVLATVVVTTHLLLQHANLDLARGPLDRLFATSPLHRFHHDRNRSDANANFGRLFIVWDVLFGTRRLPPEPAPAQIGVDDLPSVPNGWWDQLRLPFRSQGNLDRRHNDS